MANEVTDLHQRDGETLQAWLERLESIPTSTLSDHQQNRRGRMMDEARNLLKASHAKDKAQATMRKPTPTTPQIGAFCQPPSSTVPSALEEAKRAARRLSDEEWRQFVLWIARGHRGEE